MLQLHCGNKRVKRSRTSNTEEKIGRTKRTWPITGCVIRSRTVDGPVLDRPQETVRGPSTHSFLSPSIFLSSSSSLSNASLTSAMLRTFPTRRIQLAARALATHAAPPVAPSAKLTRHDWQKSEIQAIYDTPLLELVFRSASVHRQAHDPSKIQLCTLMNIKSTLLPLYLLHFTKIWGVLAAGGCTEDCMIGFDNSKCMH